MSREHQIPRICCFTVLLFPLHPLPTKSDEVSLFPKWNKYGSHESHVQVIKPQSQASMTLVCLQIKLPRNKSRLVSFNECGSWLIIGSLFGRDLIFHCQSLETMHSRSLGRSNRLLLPPQSLHLRRSTSAFHFLKTERQYPSFFSFSRCSGATNAAVACSTGPSSGAACQCYSWYVSWCMERRSLHVHAANGRRSMTDAQLRNVRVFTKSKEPPTSPVGHSYRRGLSDVIRRLKATDARMLPRIPSRALFPEKPALESHPASRVEEIEISPGHSQRMLRPCRPRLL
jgi:hypothetical protein